MSDPVRVWGEDQARPRPTIEDLHALYRQYAEEGHLVVFGHVHGDRPLDSWIAWCVGGPDSQCSAASFGNRHDPWSTGVELLSYDTAKWWGRSHRTRHGLTWQEWAPSNDVHELDKQARGEL